MNNEYFELNEVADGIGRFIQYWGFKKIHGQIWCHIFLSKEPLHAGDLIERLSVSKALVSQSLSELESYKVIKKVPKSPGKKVSYSSYPDITKTIFTILKTREQKILTQIYSSFRILRSLSTIELKEKNIDPQKVKQLGGMIKFAESFLKALFSFEKFDLTRWKNIFKPQQDER